MTLLLYFYNHYDHFFLSFFFLLCVVGRFRQNFIRDVQDDQRSVKDGWTEGDERGPYKRTHKWLCWQAKNSI